MREQKERMAGFVTGFRVVDPESRQPVDLMVYKDPGSSGLFALDASFVEHLIEESGVAAVREPFNGQRVALQDSGPSMPVVEHLAFRDADGIESEAVLLNGEVVVTSGKYDPEGAVDCWHVARQMAEALGVRVFDACLSEEALERLDVNWSWDQVRELPRRYGAGDSPEEVGSDDLLMGPGC